MRYLFHLLIITAIALSGCGKNDEIISATELSSNQPSYSAIEYTTSHPFVLAAREQIGVVTNYDVGYYEGAYPPSDSGACTDVIEAALRKNGYDLKHKIDRDFELFPDRYPYVSDPNINFRRVRNVKIFLDNYAESLSTCTSMECFKQGIWQSGDIVTFDQIPGSLWHIAFISNKTKKSVDDASVKIPYLIHNYGRGVIEDDFLLSWPASITGHYRIREMVE